MPPTLYIRRLPKRPSSKTLTNKYTKSHGHITDSPLSHQCATRGGPFDHMGIGPLLGPDNGRTLPNKSARSGIVMGRDLSLTE